MKSFRVLLAAILILLFLVSACGPSKSSKTKEVDKVTGTDGVSVAFVNNEPPAINYIDTTNNKIFVLLDVFNKGTYDAKVEIKLSGMDPSIISPGATLNYEFNNQDGIKTRYNPEGGYTSLSTELTAESGLIDVESYEFPLRATYCYNYITDAAVTVCVDPSPSGNARDDTCTPQTVTTSGQGAPISISSVDVESMGDKVRLKFNLKSHTKGEIIHILGSSAASSCFDAKRSDMNYVRYTNVYLGDTEGECPTQSPIKLRDGAGSIVCTFDLSKYTSTLSNAFKSVAKISLAYTVRDFTEKNIKIINENARIAGNAQQSSSYQPGQYTIPGSDDTV